MTYYPGVESGSRSRRRRLMRRLRWGTGGLAIAVGLAVVVVAVSSRGHATNTHPTDPTDIAVIGDFGNGSDQELAVSHAISTFEADRPAAIVTTGDNVYPDGSSEHATQAWTDPYGWAIDAHVAVVASLGNHDAETDGGQPVADLLHMSNRWYTRTIGQVEFIVLDANHPGDARQTSFLQRAIAGPDAPWTVVVFHQPMFSCSMHGSTPGVARAWLSLFRLGGVDLVLNGHDHVYERFEDIDGTPYVVTGGGGAPLYDIEACPEGTPEPISAESVHHFLWLEATDTTLTVRAVDVPGGEVFDRLDLQG